MSKMFFQPVRRPALPTSDAPRAVLLDDDLDRRMHLVERLALAGFAVVIPCDASGAISAIERDHPVLAVFMHCAETAALARAADPGMAVVDVDEEDDPGLAAALAHG